MSHIRRGAMALLGSLAICARLAQAQVVTEFVMGGTHAITAGPDGALWFTDEWKNSIGRITTDGSTTFYPLPTPLAFGFQGWIVVGPDGALWFTETAVSKIGRITTNGEITEFPTTTPASRPSGITLGPDGNLWFTEADAGKIGRITPAGVITEFPIPTASSGPMGITAGPDGALWFAEWSPAKQIGRITTAGVVTEFPASVPFFGGLPPYAVTSGPDGKVWFTGACCGLGSIAMDGTVETYPNPGDSAGNVPAVVTGPDGNLWFTLGLDQIGSITTGGVRSALSIPSGNRAPMGITVGPDGKIWFTEQYGGIGRVDFAVASILPTHGPSVGGTEVTIGGIGFEAGASLSIGGISAAATVVDASHIMATAPALAAGTLYDVVVTNPSSSTDTLPQAYLAEFGDVPGGHPFAPFIETLFRNGITGGCGGGNYCHSNPVRRDQMAVFLLKAEHGAAYDPPDCTGVFPDVPCTPGVGFPDWIEQLAAEGITGGCGGGNYCPGNPVTRQQMAVFLLKTAHSPSYTPPACGGVFDDVPCPSTFADWIEQLAAEGVTGGCQASPPLYCPVNSVTRGQMAVFLVKAFGL